MRRKSWQGGEIVNRCLCIISAISVIVAAASARADESTGAAPDTSIGQLCAQTENLSPDDLANFHPVKQALAEEPIAETKPADALSSTTSSIISSSTAASSSGT